MPHAKRLTHWILAVATSALCAMPAHARAGEDARLPKIGIAPHFILTDQDGKRLSLRGLRGKVVVVTFIFTTCTSTCPLLTAKLVGIQRQLGMNRSNVFFALVSVDPLNDTPAVLKEYAQAYEADLNDFAFLTGSLSEIEDVTSRYAVLHRKADAGSLEHTFLTSILDQRGTLRVQYLGTRFDSAEFLADLKSLLGEETSR